MKRNISVGLFCLLWISAILFIAPPASAEDKIPIKESDYQNSQVEMADSLRADGKVYVVVGTIAILMSGILIYLIKIDKSVSKLEREVESFGK